MSLKSLDSSYDNISSCPGCCSRFPCLAAATCLYHLELVSGIQSMNKNRPWPSQVTSTATPSWQSDIQTVQHQTIATCTILLLQSWHILQKSQPTTKASQLVKQVRLWSTKATNPRSRSQFFFPYSKGLMSHDKPKHGWVVITWWKPWQYTMLPCKIWQAKTGTEWSMTLYLKPNLSQPICNSLQPYPAWSIGKGHDHSET